MAGHMKSPRGPHAARGPRVGQHWLSRSPLTQGCATARLWYFNHVAICSGLGAICNESYRLHRHCVREHSYWFSIIEISEGMINWSNYLDKYGRPFLATDGFLVLVYYTESDEILKQQPTYCFNIPWHFRYYYKTWSCRVWALWYMCIGKCAETASNHVSGQQIWLERRTYEMC